ncbi:MAG: hypothetical protein A2X94_00720 [Bdellovibrionales bacterium GWB1_55_8]|nr:MAG: hypothetical protein A2X94_00720 [Bdellovibrionales bacterium GWB1_55_8]
MNTNLKKILNALFAASLLLQASGAGAVSVNADEEILIECSSVRARTHVYQVISYKNKFYFDVMSQNGHLLQRILVNQPYIFGNTFIVTAGKGPGGYVHLYHSGKTSLIDVNLVDNDLISTEAALTDFSCQKLD